MYVPDRQRVLVKRTGEFERARAVARHRVYLEDLRGRSDRFVVLAQSSTLAELGRAGCLEGAGAFWSMWAGYLDTTSGTRARALLDEHGVPLVVLHSSGHAAPRDLRRLAATIAARVIVLYSHGSPERFAAFIDQVQLRPNGSWWAC